MSRESKEWHEDSKKYYERFFRNIRFVCKNKGIQIGELETIVGVSLGYISRMEKNGKSISLRNAYSLANIVGVTIDDLLRKDFFKEMRIKELEEELKKLKADEDGSRM